jgi:uncharacterized protein
VPEDATQEEQHRHMDSMVEGIRVGAAKYGQGVYATRSFSVDETIGHVDGHVVYDCDYCSDYCIELFENCSLEPVAPFRFVNHSCSPNCQFVQYEIEDEGRIVGAEIWLETLRPIAENEQLTIDYAWPASGAILCGCDSDNCRGWIVAEEELDQLPLVEVDDFELAEEPAITAA